MGMDVYGQNPTAEVGEYFRNNVWWWRPLWEYCETVAPELCGKVEYAQSNDGDGLGDTDSIALANILDLEIASGRTLEYELERDIALNNLPDEVCNSCNGDPRGWLVREGMPEYVEGEIAFRFPCNACEGKGTKRPFQTNYPFNVENVREFAEFLRNCGGFSIC